MVLSSLLFRRNLNGSFSIGIYTLVKIENLIKYKALKIDAIKIGKSPEKEQ